jgi:hypothetical protein
MADRRNDEAAFVAYLMCNKDDPYRGWFDPGGELMIGPAPHAANVLDELKQRLGWVNLGPFRELQRGDGKKILKRANQERVSEQLPPLPPPEPAAVTEQAPTEGHPVTEEDATTFGSPGELPLLPFIGQIPGIEIDLTDPDPEIWDPIQLL